MTGEEPAALGGPRAVAAPLPPYRAIGAAEIEAAVEVLRSGCLSGFYGSWSDEYWGGPRVRGLEEAWAREFGVAHAVSLNSATSGLIAALGAIGLEPGDEVIVPPWTMSATVVAPLVWGAVPVFADVEPETFGLDPERVRAAIGPRTRAILAVDLFGHPARLAELRRLADARGLWLVEDAAQSPLASENGRGAGTVGHIGVYSLNYHKHIHAGEGGVCVTPDGRLALRLKLIRNHGENAVAALGLEDDLANLVGFNFRLTEMGAAVAGAQLAAIHAHVGRRVAAGERLTDLVSGLEGLRPPLVRPGCRHVYYLWVLRVDEEALGLSRERFCRALAAEGFPFEVGYVAPLYRLPLFRRRIALGRRGWPFSATGADYSGVRCGTCERLHEREAVTLETCRWDLTPERVADLARAVRKVHAHRARLAREP